MRYQITIEAENDDASQIDQDVHRFCAIFNSEGNKLNNTSISIVRGPKPANCTHN